MVATIYDDDNYYLICYYAKHEGVVHYRIDRMDHVEMVVNQPIDAYKGNSIDLKHHKKTLFGMFQGEEQEVEFITDKSLLDVVFDVFGESVEIVVENETTFRFKAAVQLSPTFFGWCLSFGDKLQVAGPNDVVARVIEYIQLLNQGYNGIRVEHISSPKSYEDYFYSVSNGEKSLYAGKIYGFPMQKGNWCTGRLKQSVLQKVQRNAIVYIGIAIDEPKRFHNLTETKISPLVEYGWTEKMCREWCEENGLLSPTYETSLRGGCWFCHNQSTAQLRLLRKQYPKLWAKLLAWDLDSPISFKGNGRTVHDYERRFQLEEQAKVPMDRTFRWGMMEDKSMIKGIRTFTARKISK